MRRAFLLPRSATLQAAGRRWYRPFALGYVMVSCAVVALMMLNASGVGDDARAYWSVDPLDPYRTTAYGQEGAFYYSPVAALAVAPFTWLPWPVFLGGMIGLELAALWWLVGPLALVAPAASGIRPPGPSRS